MERDALSQPSAHRFPGAINIFWQFHPTMRVKCRGQTYWKQTHARLHTDKNLQHSHTNTQSARERARRPASGAVPPTACASPCPCFRSTLQGAIICRPPKAQLGLSPPLSGRPSREDGFISLSARRFQQPACRSTVSSPSSCLRIRK